MTVNGMCEQLWKEPQINWDGMLLGCCVNSRKNFGVNVFDVGLEKALSSDLYVYTKKMLQGKVPGIEKSPCFACYYYKMMVKNNDYINKNEVKEDLVCLEERVDSKKVKVSVIVPIYNSEKYLYQALETIVGQTLQDIEIILIDDGSTDNSCQICQEFADRDNRIRLYRQENKGAGATRNRGIELAKGEYLSFLDADDFFELDMLQALYRRAKATDADIVFCDYWDFDDITKQNKEVHWGVQKNFLPSKKIFSARDCPDTIFQIKTNAVWSSLYKKSFISKNNIQFKTTKRANDIFFSRVSLILAERISCVDKRLLHYRINVPFSLSKQVKESSFDTLKSNDEIYALLEQKDLLVYKESFLKALILDCVGYEIEPLKYPLRFLSEAYFVDEIIPKYQLDTFLNEHYYGDRIEEYIKSANHSSSFRKWYEEKKDKIVPIVLTTNEKMARACGVTIQSVISHASDDYFYDIYVLGTDLSDDIKYTLKRMGVNNVQITVIPIQRFLSNYPFTICSKLSYITQDTYGRFFIPSILSYDKVLWLDSDLVVQTDISQLYDIELGDNLVAGVVDILSVEEEENRVAWRMEPLSHINAGVLVINNKLWQKEDLQKKLLDEVIHPTNSWTLNDQDIINYVCQDRILLLNYKWNFLGAAFCWKKDKYKSYVGDIEPINYYIIHYNGSIKPWNSTKSRFSVIWWKYAQESCFYQDILRQYIQSTIPEISPQSSPVVSKPSKKILTEEDIYQLKKFYVIKGLKYLFSFGLKKEKLRLEMDALLKKLEG